MDIQSGGGGCVCRGRCRDPGVVRERDRCRRGRARRRRLDFNGRTMRSSASQSAARFNKTAKSRPTVYTRLSEYLVKRFDLADRAGIGVDIGGGPGDLVARPGGADQAVLLGQHGHQHLVRRAVRSRRVEARPDAADGVSFRGRRGAAVQGRLRGPGGLARVVPVLGRPGGRAAGGASRASPGRAGVHRSGPAADDAGRRGPVAAGQATWSAGRSTTRTPTRRGSRRSWRRWA